jgi:Flp pilus assembly pilin Flp
MPKSPASQRQGATLVEAALLIALIAVAILGAFVAFRKGTQDAICSPIGGLHANDDPFQRIPKYYWNEETQNCERVTAGY